MYKGCWEVRGLKVVDNVVEVVCISDIVEIDVIVEDLKVVYNVVILVDIVGVVINVGISDIEVIEVFVKGIIVVDNVVIKEDAVLDIIVEVTEKRNTLGII